jgi:hypothetical protein
MTGPATRRPSKGAARTCNPNNQFTGTAFVWDLNGSPTSYQGVSCTWDVENRLTAACRAFSARYRGDYPRALALGQPHRV